MNIYILLLYSILAGVMFSYAIKTSITEHKHKYSVLSIVLDFLSAFLFVMAGLREMQVF